MYWNFILHFHDSDKVKIQYVSTEEKIANVMTKPLFVTKFRHFRDNHGMAENVSLVEREC